MKYLRLYADADGESHFEDVEIALTPVAFAPPAGPIAVSASEPASAFAFLLLPKGWTDVVHPSPKRQTLICLSGEVEVAASDGDVRRIGPGGVWRMEDTTGAGHQTRVVSDDDFCAAFVQFE